MTTATFIPHSRPTLGLEEADAARQTLLSGHVGTGARVREFETRLQQRLGLWDCIATASGSLALELALLALRLQPGDEIIAPSYACSAVLNAILRAGGTPRIADVSPATFGLTLETARPLRTPRTRAVLAVHVLGIPTDLEPLRTLETPIIEDCAMAIGGAGHGVSLGGGGDLSIFSFYATKLMTTGHGGAIGAQSPELGARIRDLLDYDNREDYRPRVNANLSEIQAAIGMAQLAKLDGFVNRRRQLAERYRGELQGLVYDEATAAQIGNGAVFRFAARSTDAESAIAGMQARLVEAKRPVFRPLHRYLELPAKDFPVSESLHHRLVSLPLYPSLTEAEQTRVIHAARECLKPAP